MSETAIKNGSSRALDHGLKATGPLGLVAAIAVFFGGNSEVNTLQESQAALRERVAAAEAKAETIKTDTNRRLGRIETLLDRMNEKIDRLGRNP